MLNNIKKTQETLSSSNRSFGLVFTAFFFVVGVWPVVHGASFRPLFLAASGIVLFFSLVLPKMLAFPNRVWMRFGMMLHSVTSPIVLGVMFYGLIAPMGLGMRVFGKDPLRLKFDPQAQSYWIHRIPPGPAPDSLLNQF